MAPPVPSTRLGQTLSLACFLVSEITDTGYVRRQYSTESNLETRRSVWRDSPDGRSPATGAADSRSALACFGEVTVERIDTRAVFDDHAAAVAYLSSFDATMAERLPWFEGGREYTGTPTVFLAR